MDDETKIIHKELSYKIVQACYEVHNILGPGFSENIYDEAMARELNDRGMPLDRQSLS